MNKYIVITTIHEKSNAIKKFEKYEDWHIVLVGDRKSVSIQNTDRLTFLSIDDQFQSSFSSANLVPVNHYARKNIGYLFALKNGAEIIYDTDDDNIPYESWGFPKFYSSLAYKSNRQFVNIYKYFSEDLIWPRGFPLDEISIKSEVSLEETERKSIGVWQGLADKDPDVDAICRLIFNRNIIFNSNDPVHLTENCYSPFNSQNTLWKSEVFTLLYLPSTVSFRFTDILRGYIAQRLMWENSFHLGFTGSTVFQERNKHDLITDFESEIPVYLQVKKVIGVLEKLSFTGKFDVDILKVYLELVKIGVVAKEEIKILQSWLADIN